MSPCYHLHLGLLLSLLTCRALAFSWADGRHFGQQREKYYGHDYSQDYDTDYYYDYGQWPAVKSIPV